uniref:Uncharacterized protein n=1 Tax=Plectus sambesii TaxID=2011161 RepID=A0A914V1R0_9BILA
MKATRSIWPEFVRTRHALKHSTQARACGVFGRTSVGWNVSLRHVVCTCNYAMSAVLLPVLSADLWRTMFPRKSPVTRNAGQVTTAVRTQAVVPTRPFKEANDHNIPALALERL